MPLIDYVVTFVPRAPNFECLEMGIEATLDEDRHDGGGEAHRNARRHPLAKR